MKRLKMTVYGRVQRVGYRDAVAELARKLGIKGTVRNLDDEVSVEIIAEGEDGKLNEFARLINITDKPIEVEKIDVKQAEATGELKHFKIIRGELNEELGERIDVAGTQLYEIKNLQSKTIEKIDALDENLGKKIDGLGENLGGKLDTFHHDTVSSFDTMDVKYGKISATLERISVALEALAGIKPKQ